jgi:hypothetical protein
MTAWTHCETALSSSAKDSDAHVPSGLNVRKGSRADAGPWWALQESFVRILLPRRGVCVVRKLAW